MFPHYVDQQYKHITRQGYSCGSVVLYCPEQYFQQTWLFCQLSLLIWFCSNFRLFNDVFKQPLKFFHLIFNTIFKQFKHLNGLQTTQMRVYFASFWRVEKEKNQAHFRTVWNSNFNRVKAVWFFSELWKKKQIYSWFYRTFALVI